MPQNREHGEIETVVRTHAEWVHACAGRRVGNEAMAEDVTQAVFILFWQKRGRLGEEVPVTGWLYRAVRYCAARALRAKRIRERHEREAAMAGPRDRSCGEVGWSEVSPELEEAVDRLGRRDREAVLLRFYRQMSFAEGGRCLGISEDAAQKRVERAVGKLREKLSGKGVEVEAGSLGAMVLAHAATGGPVGLVEKVMAGIGGGITNGTAGLIAKGAMKMMVMAKVKVVAACAAGVLVAGVAAEVYVAGGHVRAPMAAAAPNAAPKPAAVLTLTEEASLGAVPTVFSYHLIVDAAEAAKLKAIAREVPTASTGYTVFLLDQQTLHDTLDDWESRGIIRALGADNLTSPMLTNPVQIVSSQSASLMSLNWRSIAGEAPIQNTITGSTWQWFDRRNGACVLRLLPGNVTWQISPNDGQSAPSQHAGSMVFDGSLPPGEALVFLSALQNVGGRQYVHIRTYETFKSEYGDDTNLSSLDQFTRPWIMRGPAGVAQMARQAAVWDAMAPADDDVGKPAWRQIVSKGEEVRLRGIADGSRWPFCFWDGDGGPTRYVGSFIAPSSPAGYRQVLLEVTSENRPDGLGFWRQRVAGAKRIWSCLSSFALPPGRSELTIGVGTGDWASVGRLEVGRPLGAGSAQIELKRLDKDQRYVIPTIHWQGSADVEWRIRVIQKDGTTIDAPQILQAIVEQRDATVAERSINGPMGRGPSDFDHFEVSWRPRKWVTFRGFAMEPKVPPPADVSVEQMRTAQHVLFEKEDARLTMQVDEWRKIPPGADSPQALMRLASAAAEKGDINAITALFEPLADEKQHKMAEALAQVMVLSQRMPMVLEKRFGRETSRRMFVGPASSLDAQCATWDWSTDRKDIDGPGGGVLRKQKSGEWRLALRPEMLQMPPEYIEKQITFMRDLNAGIEDNSLKTVEQVQERIGSGMIRMLEQMSAKPSTRP